MADIKFTGNVGKDAELKFIPSGRAVLNFSVADSKSRKLDNGEWETLSEQWLECAVWGELAEFYADKIKRGSRVTVYGDFMSRKYQNKEGVPGMALEVNVKGVEIYPPKNGGGQQQGSRQGGQAQAAESTWGNQQAQNSGGWGNGSDDTVPF